MPKGEGKLIAQNKKAHHDYPVIDMTEAGMVLQRTEIKSTRSGRVSLKDGFTCVRSREAFLHNVHISPYEQGNISSHNSLRTRKPLSYKKQIVRLENELKNTGITVVPLKVYIRNSYVKISIGLAKGKKSYGKREDLKRKDIDRQIDQTLESFSR